ncbi:MAG: T9SS type A sorting domain-containing protein [Bacteroidota bacterium]
MQKITLLIFVFGFILNSQNLPNPDFENFGTIDVELFQYDFNTNAFNSSTCVIDGDGQGTFSTLANATGRPLGWSTGDDIFSTPDATSVVQTTDAFSGSSAVRIENAFFGSGPSAVGIFTAETGFFDSVPVEFTFTEIPNSIDGHYKHTAGSDATFPAGTCTFLGTLDEETTFPSEFSVYAEFLKFNPDTGENELVAEAYETFGAVSDYTSFSAPVNVIQSDVIPDRLLLIFANTVWIKAPNPVTNPGSISFVDDVSFNYESLSVESFESEKDVQILPNPASNLISVKNLVPNESINIYNISGQVVLKINVMKDSIDIDLSKLSPGLYILEHSGLTKKLIVE